MSLGRVLNSAFYTAAGLATLAIWGLLATRFVDPTIAVLGGVVATLAVFGLAWRNTQVVRQRLLEPLKNLAQTAGFTSREGYYDLRLAHADPDELGELVTAVNRILEELSQQIQEKQRATLVAEQTERLRSEFLANISHEMRTPLNAVVGLTRIVAGAPELNDSQRRYLEEVTRAAGRLATLVEDALDFSHLEAGELQLDSAPLNLGGLLDGAARHAASEATRKGLAVVPQVDALLPATVYGDPLRLGQILRILLGNAVKFTDQGQIQVAARLQGPVGSLVEVLFEVSDTGLGIPEDRQRTIFEPFSQAEGGLTRGHGGTGLGLAIASRLVEVLGGRLTVSSQLGHGSKFSFAVKFPTEAGEARGEAAPALSGEPDLKPMAILMAEDNPVNQTVAVALLETYGHSVEVAENGLQAVERIAALPYDLVLMDIQMPVMDGLTATAAIRQLEGPQGRRTPIVALTAQALRGDRERCLDAGMDGYVAKPIVPGELWAALRTVTQGRELLGPRAAAAGPPPASSGPVRGGVLCNTEALLARVGGSQKAFQKIIGQFIETAPGQLADVEKAVAASDAGRLVDSAHKFKGAAANFEAREVVDAAQQLESLGRTGTTTGAAVQSARLRSAVEALLHELRTLT